MSQIAVPAGAAIPVNRATLIQVGHVYRSKHPRLTSAGQINDREVTYVGHSGVQFASPTDGGHCIYVTHAEFRDWAAHDVTALYEGREDWHGAEDFKAWQHHQQSSYEQAA